MIEIHGTGLRRRNAVLLTALALALSACGGGGGGMIKTPPVAPSAPPAPPAPPPAPPAPPPVAPPAAQPPTDAQLSITNTYPAHAAGFVGTGVTIGIVDTGIMRSNPTVAGRVTQELIYVDPGESNTAIDDVVGHGTWVSEIAAGTAFDSFPGGIAPGASLVSARIISDVAPPDDGSGNGNQVTATDAAFFAQTLNPALISAGVQVMNNSWGGIYWDTTNATINQAFGNAYVPFVTQHGGLVVFAAGNESEANPSDIAALPSYAPTLNLDKGWLVAVAVDSNNPTQLASYSNACGVAMNYCLAAPGDVIVLDKDTLASTTDPTYLQASGTSFAAPEVSGAAALVWQAYPYFTNDLVRQTLLGTADPLGGSQPNATFGYGELDVGRAVNGPMQFNWGDVTVSFTGSSSWNNPISGAGGLIKQGTGTLNLTQPSTFTGLTQVQGGELTAKALAGGVTIGAQGTLGATPTITGSVTNAGVLVVAGGDVNITGNYTQQGNGRLSLSLGSALRITGTASLTGGDLYVTGTDSGYVVNSHTDVLTATGGLSGTFSTPLDKGPNVTLLNASIDYDANSAWLDVQQVNVTTVQGMSYTPASFGAAQRVQLAFGQINAALSTAQTSGAAPKISGSFVAAAANLQQAPDVASVQDSLQTLSGQLHAASAQMTLDAIDAGTSALSGRFDQLLSAPLTRLAFGGWSQNLGYQGSMGRTGYDGVGYAMNGWMVGLDQPLGNGGVFGYAVSQNRSYGQLSASADRNFSQAVEGMMYAGLIRGSWYTMGRFGVGNYVGTMNRNVQLGVVASGLSSDNNGRYGVAYSESGYRLGLGAWQVTPYTNLQYVNVRQNGFQEDGAGGFGLQAGAQNIDRWQAGAGLRASRSWRLDNGTALTLQANLLRQQAFAMHGDVLEASFTALQQYAPVGGIGLSRYGTAASMNLNWALSPRATVQFGYNYFSGQYQHAGTGMLDYKLTF